MKWFRRSSEEPLSLEAAYAPDGYDVDLAAYVLAQVAAVHPANADPDIILHRANQVVATLGHLVGAHEFCGGMTAYLRLGMYELPVILEGGPDNIPKELHKNELQ